MFEDIIKKQHQVNMAIDDFNNDSSVAHKKKYQLSETDCENAKQFLKFQSPLYETIKHFQKKDSSLFDFAMLFKNMIFEMDSICQQLDIRPIRPQ